VISARPEERVPVDLDIRVWGMAADGRGFSQHARAQNISASGARLCQIEHDLKIGDIIGVQAGEKKTRCKVVWAKNTGSIQKIQVGVQLLSRVECPWTTFLLKMDQPSPQSARGRRRWARHKIAFPITLQDERTVVRVTATDISGSGCYVEMLSPFLVGTALDAELWIGFSGPPSGCLPLQLLHRVPKPKLEEGSQLEPFSRLPSIEGNGFKR